MYVSHRKECWNANTWPSVTLWTNYLSAILKNAKHYNTQPLVGNKVPVGTYKIFTYDLTIRNYNTNTDTQEYRFL